jgi:endonuclease/exonuclease/phosphatase (EEP) superfamily protein YafD
VGVATLVIIEAPTIIPGQEIMHSLRFHIGAVLLALVPLLLVSKAWWRGVFLLVIVGSSLGQGALLVLRQQESRTTFDGQTPAATMRLLSFNVLSSNERGAEIADYMAQTGADVVFTMESNAVLPHLDRIATTFPYRAGCSPDGRDCDTMLFSRTPLTDVRTLQIGPFRRWRLILARTHIGGQEVTLVATHLSKPYFDEAAVVELWRIRRALRDMDGPTVIAGDFNAAAWSETIYRFVADSSLIPPPIYPATWPVRLGALGVPIDNMFTRGGARIDSIAATPDALGSNHRGLLATISLYAPD